MIPRTLLVALVALSLLIGVQAADHTGCRKLHLILDGDHGPITD